jgi:hypothetical protein
VNGASSSCLIFLATAKPNHISYRNQNSDGYGYDDDHIASYTHRFEHRFGDEGPDQLKEADGDAVKQSRGRKYGEQPTRISGDVIQLAHLLDRSNGQHPNVGSIPHLARLCVRSAPGATFDLIGWLSLIVHTIRY